MKIVADENISLVQELFSGMGEVMVLPGRQISSEHLIDADILLVRSVTKVNAALLEGSQVQFVGTCTIGTDHIDQNYLASCGIGFSSAPGCNANAVVDYVISALAALALSRQFSLNEKSVGIIGQGNVGSRLRKRLEAMGVRCLCSDPPLQRQGVKGLVSLQQLIKEADIISIHTPLTRSGSDATFHLFDKRRISRLKPGTILINTARGAVIDNDDLLACLKNVELSLVLDVWENEPEINFELIQKVELATQHIAGYSLEGKINGTVMIYKSVCDYFGKDQSVNTDSLMPPMISLPLIFNRQQSIDRQCCEAILSCYDIRKDDAVLRQTLKAAGPRARAIADSFDRLRKNYPQRREFSRISIPDKPENTEWAARLQAIGIGVAG